MTRPLQGVALVTGGGRGIGRAIAERLSTDGMRVAVAARTRGEVESVAEATGAMALQLDVTDGKAVANGIDAVERQLGPIDLLVNNAGVAERAGPLWEGDPDEWWRVFEVNVLGSFLLMRTVMQRLFPVATSTLGSTIGGRCQHRLLKSWRTTCSHCAFADRLSGRRSPQAGLAARAPGWLAPRECDLTARALWLMTSCPACGRRGVSLVERLQLPLRESIACSQCGARLVAHPWLQPAALVTTLGCVALGLAALASSASWWPVVLVCYVVARLALSLHRAAWHSVRGDLYFIW